MLSTSVSVAPFPVSLLRIVRLTRTISSLKLNLSLLLLWKLTHFEGFLSGTLKATLKSQPEPENNNGPVKVVVGTTFDSIVLDNSKDVLVKFYAPWCGHCKTLAPKYDTLGEEFANDDNIVIAKVDSTENDTPAKIEGFPTLIFYPAGNKTPVNYEGDRSVEAMAAFIRENRKSAPGAAKATQEGHEEL